MHDRSLWAKTDFPLFYGDGHIKVRNVLVVHLALPYEVDSIAKGVWRVNLNLSGKKALVTGSSRGIGKAIVRKLALEKAIVIVHGRDEARAKKVANEIVSLGAIAHVVVGDLTHNEEVEQLLETAQKLVGSIDILINNAGGSGGVKENWQDTQPASRANAYDRNVLAALSVTTRCCPRCRQRNGGV